MKNKKSIRAYSISIIKVLLYITIFSLNFLTFLFLKTVSANKARANSSEIKEIDYFERSTLNFYSGDTSKYSISDSWSHHGTRSLLASLSNGDYVSINSYPNEGLNYYPQRGDKIRYVMRYTNPNYNTWANFVFSFWFAKQDSNNRYTVAIEMHSGDSTAGMPGIRLSKRVNGESTTLASQQLPKSADFAAGELAFVEIDFQDEITVKVWKESEWQGTPWAEVSASDDTFNQGGIGFHNGPGSTVASYNGWWDFVHTETPTDWTFTNTSTGRSGTIQSWTVPDTGTYRITAYGAQGGVSSSTLGRGAKIAGDFELTQGETIEILVGQQGARDLTQSSNYHSGGGGGTFVVKGNFSSSSTSDILVIAGGGGGNSISPGHSNQHGQAGTSGASGNGSSGGSNGADGSTGASISAARGFNSARTSPSGTNDSPGEGGYVGGGGPTGGWRNRGGGGGGFSGGGASHNTESANNYGGGGGSYNNGENQDNESGVREGHGLVEIESLIPTPPTIDSASAEPDPVNAGSDITFSANWTDPYSSQVKLHVCKLDAMVVGQSSPTTYTNTSTGRSGTIQTWTVPDSGTYRITAYGAQGGTGTRNGTGGLGAKMSGEFSLQQGEIIKILVGQQGTTSGNANGPSGGGGTFVVKDNATSESDILVIAGGGGGYGVGTTTTNQDAAHGHTETWGKNGACSGCSSGSPSTGGTNGDGGSGTGNRAAAGGGFYTNGGNGSSSGSGGQAYLNGGLGGSGGDFPDGGFGSGGATDQSTGWGASGGGGGYSGGGAAYSSSNDADAAGGGGGSYNNGTNQDNQAGVRTGHGLVEIEQIMPPECWGGSWCDSPNFTSANPVTCSYTAQEVDDGINNYYIFVCDDDGLCSTSVSGSFEVITNQPPTAPTALQVNGAINPDISDHSPVFSAVYNDPDAGDIANKYRVQVSEHSNFSSPIWDSGAAGTSMSNCTQGTRCQDITYNGPEFTDHTTYYWRIKFWDDSDAEGAWSTEAADFYVYIGCITSSGIIDRTCNWSNSFGTDYEHFDEIEEEHNIIRGVHETGGGTTNISSISIDPDVTVTISPGDTIIVGEIDLSGDSGQIILLDGGVIKPGATLWYIDEDNDGYAPNDQVVISKSNPGNLTHSNNILGYDDPDDNNPCHIPGKLYACGADNQLPGEERACVPKEAGGYDLAVCTECNGSELNPVNVANNTQDTDGTNTCTTECKKCYNGDCIYQDSGENLFSHCQDGEGECDGTGDCVYCFELAESCSVNDDCCSGHCTDGVCCNNACIGACNKCNISGNIGTCTDNNNLCTDSGWDGCSSSCVKTKSNNGICTNGTCGTTSANVTAGYYCDNGSEVSGACITSYTCFGNDRCQRTCNDSGSCSASYNCSTCSTTGSCDGCSSGNCIGPWSYGTEPINGSWDRNCDGKITKGGVCGKCYDCSSNTCTCAGDTFSDCGNTLHSGYRSGFGFADCGQTFALYECCCDHYTTSCSPYEMCRQHHAQGAAWCLHCELSYLGSSLTCPCR